jgi:hypothetical protein
MLLLLPLAGSDIPAAVMMTMTMMMMMMMVAVVVEWCRE